MEGHEILLTANVSHPESDGNWVLLEKCLYNLLKIVFFFAVASIASDVQWNWVRVRVHTARGYAKAQKFVTLVRKWMCIYIHSSLSRTIDIVGF